MELIELKEKLDSTLLQYFDVLEQFYQAQARLESQMSSGLINMSRARYSMGVKAVSISQIHEDNMVASVKVLTSSPDSDASRTIYKLVDNHDKGVKTADEASSKKESGLKQRKGKKEEEGQKSSVEDVGPVERDEKEKQENEGDGEEKVTKQGGNGIVDPLRWFGVLVPQALRQSQADFKKSVESVVEVANLKQQLMSLLSTYRQLLKQKADYKADNTDCQE